MVELLRDLLPTQATKATFAVTLTLLALAYQLPQFLQPWLWPTIEERRLVIYTAVLMGTLALFGSLVTLLFILHHKRTNKSFWEDTSK